MRVSVILEASESSGFREFDLEQLGLTEEQWGEMSDLDKQAAIQEAVFDLPEQPYWVVDSFSEED